MTRSFPPLHRAPRLAAPSLGLLLGLALATTGCGGGGDASATPASLWSSAPASAVVSAAANGGTTGPSDPIPAAPEATVASTGTTAVTRAATSSSPSTTVRPATTAAPSTTPPTSSPPSTPTSTTATTGGGAAGQRLTGTVTASPTCPVERPDQPCPPRPVAGAHVEVFDRSERLVTSADADGEGRFALTLVPGRYVLTASSSTVLPSCPALTVDVPASGSARADITCDTGIR